MVESADQLNNRFSFRSGDSSEGNYIPVDKGVWMPKSTHLLVSHIVFIIFFCDIVVSKVKSYIRPGLSKNWLTISTLQCLKFTIGRFAVFFRENADDTEKIVSLLLVM